MRLLLDSSGAELVCALAGPDRIVAEMREPALGAGRDLARVIGAVLGEFLPRDIDGIVVGLGPGSFIGTRAAISFANGYAAASGVPLYGVNSLAAIGALEGDPGCAVLRDARRQQFFCWFSESHPDTLLLGPAEAVSELQRRGIARAVLEESQAAAGKPPPAEQLVQELGAAGIELTTTRGVPAEGLRLLQASGGPAVYLEPIYLRGFT